MTQAVVEVHWMDRIEVGDETWITPAGAQTRVRGGGASGGGAWVAAIAGEDAKYGFARGFLRADRTKLSGSGRSGEIRWDFEELDGPEIIEFRGFAVGCHYEKSGFAVIAGGSIASLNKSEANALIRAGWEDANTADRRALLGLDDDERLENDTDTPRGGVSVA